MGGMDVQQDGHVGPSQSRKRLDLARVIGADLVDRRGRLARRSRQGERHADVVIQAAGRGERVEGGSGERLERRLAAAPGYRHDRTLDAFPGRATQGPEPIQRIRHPQLGDPGSAAPRGVSTSRWTSAATAPFATACFTKSWPSRSDRDVAWKRGPGSPGSATKRSPGSVSRESIAIPRTSGPATRRQTECGGQLPVRPKAPVHGPTSPQHRRALKAQQVLRVRCAA